jgi:glycosyltransferase involved in cell wall biosynthesis
MVNEIAELPRDGRETAPASPLMAWRDVDGIVPASPAGASMPHSRSALEGRSLAIYLPDLSGGGAERLQIDLARCFIAAGLEVTLVLAAARGALLPQVPPEARTIALGAARQRSALWPFVRYLRSERPDILCVHTEHTALAAIWARALARVATRIVVCQHNTLSAQSRRANWQYRVLPLLFRLFASRADAIVAVSEGVAEDLVVACGLSRDRVSVIYNGVAGGDFALRSAAPPEHRWYAEHSQVIVAAGRLVEQKDFATLLRAFALVAQRRAARLILLGEGPLRASLEALARTLGVADRIDMPGFRANPLPYLRSAAAVVLSSRYEGFGLVLAEALACGTPVVSTDCPHGPAEILDHGRYGRLVPVGDPESLARAILATLDAPPARQSLCERGAVFTIERCAEAYLELFGRVLMPHEEGAARLEEKSA